MSLVEEAKKAIKNSGHVPYDIDFIGDRSRHVTLGSWQTFCEGIDEEEKKKDPDDSQKCGLYLFSDLIIAFSDSSFIYRTGIGDTERWEYMPSRGSTDYPPAALQPKAAMYPRTPFSRLRDVVIERRVDEFRNRMKKDFDLK